MNTYIIQHFEYLGTDRKNALPNSARLTFLQKYRTILTTDAVHNQFLPTFETIVSASRKTNTEKNMTKSQIIAVFTELRNIIDNARSMNPPVVGFGFKKPQRRKVGSGTTSTDFEKGKIYLDMTKLNSNTLSIKYRKTGNKAMDDFPISDKVKSCIVDICTGKFDKQKFNKLALEEKKAIVFFNDKFGLEEISENNPVISLNEEYKVLIGELEAGNNSSLIKKRLKQILFELVKYKKISSSKMRNICFQLDNSD